MKKFALVISAMSLFATAAQAQVLDFEGIATTYPFGPVNILNYYNGGTSAAGTSGANLGVTFSPTAQALCLTSFGGTANCSVTSRGGLGDAGSAHTGLYFISGTPFINVAAGFQNEFALFYSSIATTTVRLFDGLSGAGALLGTLVLAANANEAILGPNCPNYGAIFCPFFSASLSFAGTARSVTLTFPFGETAFDDIRFGSAQVVTPEPSSMLLAAGGLLGLAAAARRRRRD